MRCLEVFRGIYLGIYFILFIYLFIRYLQVANTANSTLVGLPRGIMGTRQ